MATGYLHLRWNRFHGYFTAPQAFSFAAARTSATDLHLEGRRRCSGSDTLFSRSRFPSTIADRPLHHKFIDGIGWAEFEVCLARLTKSVDDMWGASSNLRTHQNRRRCCRLAGSRHLWAVRSHLELRSIVWSLTFGHSRGKLLDDVRHSVTELTSTDRAAIELFSEAFEW